MNSTKLAAILSPFAVLANKHAMSPIYKTLEIAPDMIRGCAPWGVLEVDAEIGTQETFWVDAAHFVGVVKTLPAGEVTFTQGASLSWECGSAQGKLALLPKMDIPTHEWEEPATAEENVDSEFPNALQLGSLSASRDVGMSSSGVSGVALTWQFPWEEDPNGEYGRLYITSSDNVTMSVCSTLMIGAKHWPNEIVVNTEAAAMLGTILRMSAGSAGAFLDVQEKMITAYANDFRLMVRAAPPMKHNILELTESFPREKVTTKLPAEVVKRFIARASALAEAKAHTHVKFAAENGGLRLSFAEGTVMSDEQYKIAELAVPDDFPEVRLDAGRLARALGYADMLALDAFDRGVLTLFTSPEKKGPVFAYLINGAQEKGA